LAVSAGQIAAEAVPPLAFAAKPLILMGTCAPSYCHLDAKG
jgi:hypothetical protein